MNTSFSASFLVTFGGHMTNCDHYDHGICTCTKEGLELDARALREEQKDNEEVLSKSDLNISEMKYEVARLRASVKWQQKSMESVAARQTPSE